VSYSTIIKLSLLSCLKGEGGDHAPEHAQLRLLHKYQPQFTWPIQWDLSQSRICQRHAQLRLLEDSAHVKDLTEVRITH